VGLMRLLYFPGKAPRSAWGSMSEVAVSSFSSASKSVYYTRGTVNITTLESP
jgi:hypothetical protein